MAMVEYNRYPEAMREMATEEDWNDFFTFCIEQYESRQAYPDENIYQMHEDLRIRWVDKADGLGFCTGRTYKNHKQVITHYKIGTEEAWNKLKCRMAATFARDNS